jgi:hypothetical protein
MMVNKHFYPLGPCENSLNLEKITGKNIYIYISLRDPRTKKQGRGNGHTMRSRDRYLLKNED